MRTWLVLGILCVAHSAHGDARSIEGYGGIGIRASSTTPSTYDDVYEDTSRVRFAAECGVGWRFGRLVLEARVGMATPLRFSASPLADSGEIVAVTDSAIYPVDLGADVQVALTSRFWLSAWFGATIAFSYATSPAAHIEAVDYSGDIPAASWTDHSMGLGLGGELGYDVVVDEHGRFAVSLGVESQGIDAIPMRDNGGTWGETDGVRTTSVTFGLAYRY